MTVPAPAERRRSGSQRVSIVICGYADRAGQNVTALKAPSPSSVIYLILWADWRTKIDSVVVISPVLVVAVRPGIANVCLLAVRDEQVGYEGEPHSIGSVPVSLANHQDSFPRAQG